MCVPLIAIVGSLIIYPAFYSMYLATLNKAQTRFIGLGNFTFLLSRDTFWMVVEQSAIFALTAVLLAALRAWRLPRVTMLIQYLYRDEPQLSRFQTGLVFVDDRPKPSLNAFRLPFAEMRRSGFQTVVWGQIRGARPGRKPYRLEVLHRNVWIAVGHDRLTNDDGVFVRTIRLKRGALLRIWSPRQRLFSLRLRVR